MTLASEMERFFSEDGPLADLLPGYRARPAQIEMAERVAAALEDPASRLIVEAGTGTGKSLAYLVPALLSGQQVSVATGTKALQDQLYEKDLPVVVAAVEAFTGQKKRAALMKGRQNYLCLTRWERFSASPTFAFHDDAQHLTRLRSWVEKTEIGDKAEVPGLPESFATWADLDAGSETCVGQKCPAFADCYVTKMRRTAEEADVIVVNHHLLCADLRVRLEGMPTGDGEATWTQVIPDVDAVIVDEAHQLAEVATDYFGVHYATGRGDRLKADIARFSETADADLRAHLERALIAFEVALDEVIARLGPPGPGQERRRLGQDLADEQMAAHKERIEHALADVCVRLESLAETVPSALLPEVGGLVRRAESVAVELGFLLDKALKDSSFVTWLEPKKRGFSLSAAPVDVTSALKGTLFDVERPVILTSATLAVGGTADAYLRRVGLHAEPEPSPGSGSGSGSDPEQEPDLNAAETLILPSPFAFEKKAGLYAPSGMPTPDEPAFFDRFCDEVRFLTELTGGGALLLFTSVRALDKACEVLGPELTRAGRKVLKQGEAPKLRLLEGLKEGDAAGGAVLFATQSFWEGVDVPGAALRLVVIDRLPFKPPTDPLQKARYDLFEAQGLSSFQHVSVPEAALSLKQGVGRLLRTEEDAGLVAVLDGRLRKRRYGRVFLETLPPLVRLGSQRVVQQFWERVVAPTVCAPAEKRPESEQIVVEESV